VIVTRLILLKMRAYRTNVVEKNKTHLMFHSGSRAVYETMWKNMLEPNRPAPTM